MRSLQGHLLVASPRLPDVNFYRTVVLIIHHDDQGAFGIVLNRPTESTVDEIWDDVPTMPGDAKSSVNSGGPVEGPLMAIHTNEAYGENEIMPGVHFAAHKDHLNRLVRDPQTEYRVYTGYSGWAAGQLEGELEFGGWMVMPARRDVIFSDPESMWQNAAQEIGEDVTGELLGSAAVPRDPACN
jgi:putative transcriptional regulator